METIEVRRHDRARVIHSDLDPIEDMLNLMSGLKSRGYVKELLGDVHAFRSRAEIDKTASQISLHADIGLELAEQAMGSRAETSFLPLYYTCLDLSKIYLLFAGKRAQLASNRLHGASYDGSQLRKNLLNQTVKIHPRGTISLTYATMLSRAIPVGGAEVSLQEIYSLISAISAEYETICGQSMTFFEHRAVLVRDDKSGHYLQVSADMSFDPTSVRPKPSELQAYPGLRTISKRQEVPLYRTPRRKGSFDAVAQKLTGAILRNLISDDAQAGNWRLYCPISSKTCVLNEDLSILLAFFHMSNVVRYNPEHLHKIMDSKYWIVLMALRKHGYLRFLKLMWGHYQRESIEIN